MCFFHSPPKQMLTLDKIFKTVSTAFVHTHNFSWIAHILEFNSSHLVTSRSTTRKKGWSQRSWRHTANMRKSILTGRNSGHRWNFYLHVYFRATCSHRYGHHVGLAPVKANITTFTSLTTWYLLQGYCTALWSVSVLLRTVYSVHDRKKGGLPLQYL